MLSFNVSPSLPFENKTLSNETGVPLHIKYLKENGKGVGKKVCLLSFKISKRALSWTPFVAADKARSAS